MYIADYHLHTDGSCDGRCTIEEACEMAIARGADEIAITDHIEMLEHMVVSKDFYYQNIHDQITWAQNHFAGRLVVKRGAEIGQPLANLPEITRYLKRYRHDFIIGSIHKVFHDKDLCNYNFAERDCNSVYQNYVHALIQMAKEFDFDVMGHITYPLRYMSRQGREEVDLKNYRPMFRELFRLLIERGKGIEVNTSGLRQSLKETLPPFEVVKLYKECGGEIVTVGSDSHFPAHVLANVRDGYTLLKEAGFAHYATFTDRLPEFHTIE